MMIMRITSQHWWQLYDGTHHHTVGHDGDDDEDEEEDEEDNVDDEDVDDDSSPHSWTWWWWWWPIQREATWQTRQRVACRKSITGMCIFIILIICINIAIIIIMSIVIVIIKGRPEEKGRELRREYLSGKKRELLCNFFDRWSSWSLVILNFVKCVITVLLVLPKRLWDIVS